METWKAALGLGFVWVIAACSSTRLPVVPDAAAPSGDAPVAVEVARDTRGDTQGAGPVVPDAAVPVVDAGAPVVDVGAPVDAGAPVLDAPRTPPDAGTVVSDAPLLARDTAPVLPDGALGDKDTGSPAPDAQGPVDPYANRTFRIAPDYPAPTPDPTCTQYGPSDYFQFTFGPRSTTLKVLMVSGSAAQPLEASVGPEAAKLTYHIESLAGGTVTFERDQGVAVAQAIVYGSGVPVIRCLRGALLPQP